jgi:putative sterol carrier protein
MAALTARWPDRPRRFARARGRQAFQAFVHRANDARLERIAGSDAALGLIFAAMTSAYEPDKAHGFMGELEYDLRRADGRVARWTVRVDPERATARRGPAVAPALTLTVSVADFLRIAAGDIDAGRALLSGRLDLAGDFSLAQRLGEMFGRPTAL